MALFLSSEIHQGDDLFSVQSRGKQCAFMSLSAVLTAQNIPAMIDWSKTTLNNVLLQGDKMYLQALDNGFVVLEPGVEFLSVDNSSIVVGISSCTNMFSYQIGDSVIDTSNLPPVEFTTCMRKQLQHLWILLIHKITLNYPWWYERTITVHPRW
jgi:hypothetical protein